ncbi:hypothetical protein T260_13375 [Geobacillus thermopakistaniensis]|uniref:Uncharacterized protein n=1 Tax=Geobacillus thermopakistaniensis (strain MAS1) TaxID=1408282 RepID=A0A7U9J9U5_GEOTM|nr:hypothetical protein T260_13375 [Geobacillus sp. MAS1]
MTDDVMFKAKATQPICAYDSSIVERKIGKSAGMTACIASFKKWPRLMANKIG